MQRSGAPINSKPLAYTMHPKHYELPALNHCPKPQTARALNPYILNPKPFQALSQYAASLYLADQGTS